MVKAAKKRKKEEDEEFEFPEFDEGTYLRKEVALAKATFVTIVLSIPVAGLLYALTIVNVPIVAFFLGLAITFTLPRVYAVLPWPRFDLAKFERKDWIGQGGTFFLSWLTVWILLLNVPFADVTPPLITNVTAYDGHTQIDVRPGGVQQSQQLVRGTIWINASVFENGRLDSVTMTVQGNIGPLTPKSLGSLRYSFEANLPETRDITIMARDGAGLESSFGFQLNVG